MTKIVSEKASISTSVQVGDDVRIYDSPTIMGNSVLEGQCGVRDTAYISASRIGGLSLTMGKASVYESRIMGSARVSGNSNVNNSFIGGSAMIEGYVNQSYVGGNAYVMGGGNVKQHAKVFGNAQVSWGMNVGRFAEVFRPSHTLLIEGVFNEAVTIYRDREGNPRVSAGCQNFLLSDTVDELRDKYSEHEWNVPDGWELLRLGLLKFTAQWKNDEPADWMISEAGFDIKNPSPSIRGL